MGSITHWRGESPLSAEFLTADGVARSRGREFASERLLHCPVGVTDRREVGLGVNLQVARAKSGE